MNATRQLRLLNIELVISQQPFGFLQIGSEAIGCTSAPFSDISGEKRDFSPQANYAWVLVLVKVPLPFAF